MKMSLLTDDYLQDLYKKYGRLGVLDDIITNRAADDPPTWILGYPRESGRVDDYEYFTGKQLDRYIDGAAKKFMSLGIRLNETKPVALLGPSNLDFIVSLFALSRLGRPVLCLSLRVAPVAIVNLLEQTGCSTIIHGHTHTIASSIAAVRKDHRITALSIPARNVYEVSSPEPPFRRAVDRVGENLRPAVIMHSSGSTGLPKPVILSHRALLTHVVQGAGVDNFGVMPLYHLYGVSTTLQAMYVGKKANIFDASLPLTADNLISAIETTRPRALHFVPYALGLLAEKPKGVDLMRGCDFVTAASARTPDELGDRLVQEGVNLAVVYGTTEAGLAGDTMRRPPGDDSWNYIRFYPYHRKYIYMGPLGDNQFEAVYLKGHPALMTSNSDNPAPGSWRSKDVFTPHPTAHDAWKFVTRIDDRVTLLNGEKVLPLPIEGRLREDPLIREAVVVGVDKPVPGLLVFSGKTREHLSSSQYLDAIWPSVADANSRAEAFSRITRDMITVLPADVDYPKTDKGSIIRARVYKMFSRQIKDMYSEPVMNGHGRLQLGLPQMEQFLLGLFANDIGIPIPSPESDFFAAGVDSLRAIQARRVFQSKLDLGGAALAPNVVYECGNVRALAKHLHSLRTGRPGDVKTSDTALLKELVGKYSRFGDVVLLTGATGSIGAHTLAHMAASTSIRKIYCLVRGPDPTKRVLDSLAEKHLNLNSTSRAKIMALTADLSEPDFGLGDDLMGTLQESVTLILHIAWPVNFNLPLRTFEPHLAGLQNLIRFSMSVPATEPARLFFFSSVSTAFNMPADSIVPEAPIHDLEHADSMGYAQSKLAGEHIVLNAARAGARTYVLRVGQVVGDSAAGIWSDREAIPSLIRSALALKALPRLGQRCSWLPVDTLATAILELCKAVEDRPSARVVDAVDPAVIYNIVNPHEFMWGDLLAELKEAGLDFEAVSTGEWLDMMRESAANGDVEKNPGVKLLDYYEREYGARARTNPKRPGKGSIAVTEGFKKSLVNGWRAEKGDQSDHERVGGLRFDTAIVQRDCAVLRDPPKLLEDGFVKKFVASWLPRWRASSVNGS